MDELKRDDYNEFCGCAAGQGIPTDRVLDKLDMYFAADDYAGAERHLKYWMAEARTLGDGHGYLTLANECVGLYRKTGKAQAAMDNANAALKLLKTLDLENTVTAATTYINVGTAHCAFEDYKSALPYYEDAKAIYEAKLPRTDGRLGGLYNNMALCVMALGDLDRAESLFYAAIAVMKDVADGGANEAITYCNLADLEAARHGDIDGETRINALLDKAAELLDGIADRTDGAYAYACEKCAPTFGHYGYFAYENELTERARRIYEGH